MSSLMSRATLIWRECEFNNYRTGRFLSQSSIYTYCWVTTKRVPWWFLSVSVVDYYDCEAREIMYLEASGCTSVHVWVCPSSPVWTVWPLTLSVGLFHETKGGQPELFLRSGLQQKLAKLTPHEWNCANVVILCSFATSYSQDFTAFIWLWIHLIGHLWWQYASGKLWSFWLLFVYISCKNNIGKALNYTQSLQINGSTGSNCSVEPIANVKLHFLKDYWWLLVWRPSTWFVCGLWKLRGPIIKLILLKYYMVHMGTAIHVFCTYSSIGPHNEEN